jgi:uncharacterized RDD family membrane protein YckC
LGSLKKEEVGAKAEAEAEAENPLDSLLEIAVEAKAKAEAKAEVEAKAEAEAKAKAEAEAKAKAEAEAKAKAEAKAEAEAEAKAETENAIESLLESVAQTQAQTESLFEGVVETPEETKVEAGAETEVETKAETEAGTEELFERAAQEEGLVEREKKTESSDESAEALGMLEIAVEQNAAPISGKSLDELLAELSEEQQELPGPDELLKPERESTNEFEALLSQIADQEDEIVIESEKKESDIETQVVEIEEGGVDEISALLNQLESNPIKSKKVEVAEKKNNKESKKDKNKGKGKKRKEIKTKATAEGKLWKNCRLDLSKEVIVSDEIGINELYVHSCDEAVLVKFNLLDEELSPSGKARQRRKLAPKRDIKIKSNLDKAVAQFEKEQALLEKHKKRGSREIEQSQRQEILIKYARAWQRSAALVVDLTIISFATLLLAWIRLVPTEVKVRIFKFDSEALYEILPYLGDICITFGVFWIIYNTLLLATSGTTIGGKIFRIYFADEQGFFLEFKHAFLRTLCQATTLLTLGLGILTILGKDRRTLHDRLARTTVLRQIHRLQQA